MRYAQVRVLRTELSSHVQAVAPWELPVLRVVYPEEAVVEIGSEDVAGELPETNVEMDRLVRKYGMDNETGVPFAVQAYGLGQMGLRALEREIKASQTAPTMKQLGVADLTA